MGFYYGVMCCGYEGSHVEGFADISAASFDVSALGDRSAVLIDGSNPDEGSDLVAVEVSELRNEGEQACGSDQSYAFDRAEKVVGSFKQSRVLDVFCD